MSIELTKFTDAGGCGCKIAPKVLDEILSCHKDYKLDNNIIVSNTSKDDASIYRISETQGVVSSLDFFSPIVNDPFTFGEIATANALSDIYAMGGKPLWALSILGIPLDLIESEIGKEIISGAHSMCNQAGISIIGGHSINNPQPIFGLSVNGIINLENIKKNKDAKVSDNVFLTKPLGIGILSTALKLGKLSDEHYKMALHSMLQLNSIGMIFSSLPYVNAMTDITGFGLLGHLLEVCQSSRVGAILYYDKVKVIGGVEDYIKQNVVTNGGKRNWDSYEGSVFGGDQTSKIIMSDPQTNGGLLITVKEEYTKQFQNILKANGLDLYAEPIGQIVSKPIDLHKTIYIK